MKNSGKLLGSLRNVLEISRNTCCIAFYLTVIEPVDALLPSSIATVALPLLIELFNMIPLLTFDSAITLNDITSVIANTAAVVVMFSGCIT